MSDKTTKAMTQDQEQAKTWTPAAFGSDLKLWFDPSDPRASVQEQAEPTSPASYIAEISFRRLSPTA